MTTVALEVIEARFMPSYNGVCSREHILPHVQKEALLFTNTCRNFCSLTCPDIPLNDIFIEQMTLKWYQFHIDISNYFYSDHGIE